MRLLLPGSCLLRATFVALALAAWAAPPGGAQAPGRAVSGVQPTILSVQGMDCSSCWLRLQRELLKIGGVTAATLDTRTVDATVTTSRLVSFDSLRTAAERAGFQVESGPGKGRWKAPKGYPDGSDVAIVSHDGATVGELVELAVPGKVTLVDLYADWCGPCRMIDKHVATLLEKRSDLAVRKINIVKWGSPAARKYLGKSPAIPLVLVYGLDGVEVAQVSGFRPKDLEAAIEKGAAAAAASSENGASADVAPVKAGAK